jgi:hypothetical protein
MMLALPVQGMAAAAMAGCAPGHPMAGLMGGEVRAAGHAGHAQPTGHHGAGPIGPAVVAGHAHHAMAGDEHPAAAHAAQLAESAMAGIMDGEQDGASGHDMLKCCSVTCSMVALTGQATVASPQVHAVAPLHPLASHYRGVTLAGPERPPKPLLA